MDLRFEAFLFVFQFVFASVSFLGSNGNAKLLIIKSNAHADLCRAYESHFLLGRNSNFRVSLFLAALDVVSCPSAGFYFYFYIFVSGGGFRFGTFT